MIDHLCDVSVAFVILARDRASGLVVHVVLAKYVVLWNIRIEVQQEVETLDRVRQ